MQALSQGGKGEEEAHSRLHTVSGLNIHSGLTSAQAQSHVLHTVSPLNVFRTLFALSRYVYQSIIYNIYNMN